MHSQPLAASSAYAQSLYEGVIIPSEQYSMFLGHLYEKTSKASAQPQCMRPRRKLALMRLSMLTIEKKSKASAQPQCMRLRRKLALMRLSMLTMRLRRKLALMQLSTLMTWPRRKLAHDQCQRLRPFIHESTRLELPLMFSFAQVRLSSEYTLGQTTLGNMSRTFCISSCTGTLTFSAKPTCPLDTHESTCLVTVC